MAEPRGTRLVERALRCYPDRWRRRHGDEAAELAALLIRDGASASSIALSYLVGAAREWLTPGPGQRLSTAACGLLIVTCCLSASAALVASSGPARAAVSPVRPRSAGPSQVHNRPPRCRPGDAETVPGLFRAMLPVIIREGVHDPSC